jgi:hypothetical protein
LSRGRAAGAPTNPSEEEEEADAGGRGRSRPICHVSVSMKRRPTGTTRWSSCSPSGSEGGE